MIYVILSQGFEQSKVDRVQDGYFPVVDYVPDILVANNDLASVTTFKSFLHDKSRLKDLGPLKCFLVHEIARSIKGISPCQSKYTLELLADAGVFGS